MRPAVRFLSLLIGICGVLFACGNPADPINGIQSCYDDVIGILKASGGDKTTLVREYWNARQAEISRFVQSLTREMASLSPASRESFARRFETLLSKLVTIRDLFHEQGVEL